MADGQPKRLLDQVRDVMRVRRYALRTGRAYCDWIRRYIKFHRMQSRQDLAGGKEKVECGVRKGRRGDAETRSAEHR